MLGRRRKAASGVLGMVDRGSACLHRGTRTDPGCGLTGEHPGSAQVQVKCQEIVEGFLHMLVEARVKNDKGNTVLHI